MVTLPSQFAKAYDINEGDEVEIIPLKHGELKIRKITSTRSGGFK